MVGVGQLLGALALLGVGLPIAAHLLFSVRPPVTPFAAVAWLPSQLTHARERNRLRDRALLGSRILMVLLFALLGMSPWVRCTSYSMVRSQGEDMAIAIILDDSQSMSARAGTGSRSRFDEAREAALDLLASTRTGDAITVVLAGAPARTALASTLQHAAVAEYLKNATVTDRATDLRGALQLASVATKEAPHETKRIVVLSDWLQGTTAPVPDVPFVRPIQWPAPSATLECALLRAERSAGSVRVSSHCSGTGSGTADVFIARGLDVLAKAQVHLSAGAHFFTLATQDLPTDVWAQLSWADHIERNNRVAVPNPPADAAQIALVGSRAIERRRDPNVLESALQALGLPGQIRTLPLLPHDATALAGLSALIVDDPPGFPPESRMVVGSWVRQGGHLILFLGSGVEQAQLGSQFDPFLTSVTWNALRKGHIDPSSAAHGIAIDGLDTMTLQGRAEFRSEGEAWLLWDDQAPLVTHRAHGAGSITVIGVSASANQSDFPLRPAFLSILRRTLERTGRNVPWALPGEAVSLPPASQWMLDEGPEAKGTSVDTPAGRAVPERAGRMRRVDAASSFVVGHPHEETNLESLPTPTKAQTDVVEGGAPEDLSRIVACLLLMLAVVELVLRRLSRRQVALGSNAAA